MLCNENIRNKSDYRKWAKINHYLAAKNATINITDNSILQKSLFKSFNSDSIIIRYGGNHNLKSNIDEDTKSKYKFVRNKS